MGGCRRLDLISHRNALVQRYYELCLQLVRPGGVVAVDNVLWYGKVSDPEVQDKATQAIRAINDKMAADERVHFSIVPIGDGLALCVKK